MFRMCKDICHEEEDKVGQVKLQSRIFKPQTPLEVSRIKEVRDKYDELAQDKAWLEKTEAYDVVDRQSTYYGAVKQNLPHGFGRLANPDGSLYEGEFKEGVGDGEKSLYIYPDGSYYKGKIKNSKANGDGVFVYKNEELIYKGAWNRDLPHGFGQQKLSDGSVYEGEFIQGLKSGKGIFIWPNGDKYDGQFLSGLIDGEGTFISKETGYKYVGSWQKNQKNGEGTQYFQDGTVIRCNFENGSRIGTIIVTKNGVSQQGEQRQGRFFVFKNKST